jgi:PKD repeat protein
MLLENSLVRRVTRRLSSKQSVSVRRARRPVGQSFGRAVGRLFETLETRRLLALVASFGGNKTVAEGSVININGNASTVDAPATIVSYRWDLNYNAGLGFRTTVTGQGFNFNASDGPGTRNIALRVVSSTGATNTTTGTITITNVAPTLGFTVPANANEGESFNVAFAKLADPGVDTLTGWSIDWGDGNTNSYAANLMDGSHTYNADGTYTVTLTATDEDGSYTATRSINVANVTPIVNVSPASQTINEGSSATVNFSTSNRVGTLELWTIDWGDGNTGVYDISESSASHTFADNGSYTVKVTGVEPDGATDGFGTSTVVVNNVNPGVTISGTPGGNVNEGAGVSLTANPTDVGVNDTFSYAWTVTKNGSAYDLTGITTNAANFAFNPSDNGAYVATVTVTDKDGGTATATASFTVVNVAPSVTLSVAPSTSEVEGTAITVSTNVTDVAGDTTYTYAWSVTKDMGAYTLPNSVATDGASLTFTPRDNGNYLVTVVVTDDDGGARTITSSAITITNAAPVASFSETGTTSTKEGDSLAFASTSTDVGEDDTLSHSWSVTRNGSAYDLTGITTNSNSFDFTPNDNGTYVVTMTVTDDDGASDTATSTFSVSNVAPVATAGNATGDALEGSTLSFTASSTDVGSADTVSYAWSVTKNGNAVDLTGITSNQAAFSFTPDDNATYVFTVTATDDDGGTDTDSTTVVVGNVNPTPTIGDVTVPTDEGSQAEFSASATDAGTLDDNAGYTYAWSATLNGDPITTGSSSTFQFTPTDNGTVVVTLSATDKDGGSSSTTRTFSVGNVNPTGNVTGEPMGNVDEGTAVNLTAVPSDAGSSDTFTYAWSVTKGGSAYDLTGVTTDASTLTFTPLDNGTFVATVVITDDDGGTVSVASSNIVVDNVAPVANISGIPGNSVNEGSTVGLTALPYDPSVDTFTYAWTVTRGGQTYDTATGVNYDFVPDDEGTYTIELVVTDDDGGVSTAATETIIADNVNPSGSISAAPANIMEGVQVDMTSNVLDGGAADVLTYAWSVTKDGNSYDLTGITTNQSTFSFSPNDNGNYVITLTVTDGDGGSVTLTSNAISVANENPTGAITGAPASGVEGSAITVGSTVSDVSGDTVTRTWSVTKDGNAFTLPGGTNTSGANFTFTPTDNGTYVISLGLSDEDGGANSCSTSSFVVSNANPTAAITEVSVPSVEGDDAEFTAGATDPGAADTTFTYDWTVKIDGNDYFTWQGSTLVFTPPDNGTYAVTLTATDKDSGVSSAVTNTYVVTNATPTGTIGGDYDRDEGMDMYVSVTPADLGSADTFTYSWSVTKNGSPVDLTGIYSTGDTLIFTPDDEGSYVFTARVTDDDGAFADVVSRTVAISNAAPEITFSGDTTGTEGVAVNIGSSVVDLGINDTIASYSWSVTKDGNPFDLTGVTTNTSTLSFTPTDNATYVATLAVTDNDGGTGTASVTINVANANPTGTITGTPSLAPEGGTILVGSTASDVAADTITRSWSVIKDGNAYTLGGGVTTNGVTFNFVPNDNGTFVIRLTLTDEDGGSTTIDSSEITVTNANPTVTISGKPGGSVAEGSSTTLTANAADPGSADTFTYVWSATRNGSPVTVSNNTSSTFAFNPTDNGTWVVTVVVTDDDGATATANTGNMTVTNVNPTANITGAPGSAINEGAAVNLTANASDVGVNDTLTYAWSVTKNGSAYSVTNNTSSTFSFTPNDEGTYVATVVVTDKDGGTVTVATGNIVVNNVAPTGTLTGIPGGSVNEGSAVTVGVDVVDPGSTDTFTYAWTVLKNGNAYATGSSSSFSFTPNDQGTYSLTLILGDNDGGSTTINGGSITVVNAAPTANITGDTTGMNEGSSSTLTAEGTDPSTVDNTAGYTYAWTVTKGGSTTQTGNTAVLAFAPTDNGTYVVSLVVTDKDGAASTAATRTVTVGNVAPTPTISGLPGAAVDEGSQLSLTASATDPSTADTTAGFTYGWTITRGGSTVASGSTSSISYALPDNGTYTVTLTATDKDGSTGTTSGTVTVNNTTPTASITGSTSGMSEGDTASLTASVTDAGSADTFTYAWTVTKGGNTTQTGSASSFTFAPTDNGTYTISLVVTDKDGASSSTATRSVSVASATPVPTITGLPGSAINEGASISLTASATDASTADTTAGFTYAWTLATGGNAVATSNTSSFTHTFADNGTYTVTLTATDKDGVTGTTTSTITVNNVAPVATINGTTSSMTEGDSATLTASATDAGSADTFTYAWTVTKGGNTTQTGSSSSFTFSPTDNGTYVISLVATDKDGTASTAATRSVTVASAAPAPTITGLPGSTINEGASISLTASATDASSADTTDGFTYAWTLTRGGSTVATGNTSSFTHTFADNGTYTVTLAATDKDGVTGTTTGTVTVNNVAPTASISGSTSGLSEGDSATVTANATDAGSADVEAGYTYAWTVTKGGNTTQTGTASSFTFAPNDNGTYVISLVVTDKDGAASTAATRSVTVASAAPVPSITAPTTGTEGTSVTATASATDAGSLDTTAGFTYSWTVTRGGDTVATGSTASLTFVPDDNGTYTLSVTATDKDGVTGTTTSSLAVSNVNPVGSITGDSSGLVEGNSVVLGSSVTDAGSADTIAGFTYAWSVTRNSSVVGTGTSSSYDFSPTDNGVYTVELTVTDKDGGSHTSSRTISVANANPVGTINGLPVGSVNETAEISLTASVADPSSADTTSGFTYGWSVTKGSTVVAYGNTANLTFVVPDNGTYIVSLTVTDKDSGNTTTTGTITALNVAPASVAISNLPGSPIVEGTSATLGVTSVDAPDDSVTYAWTVTRGGTTVQTGSGAEFTFNAPDNGTYGVTVVATDKDGGTGTATGTITVTNANPTATLTGPAFTPVRGQTFGLTLTANDVPADAGLTYSINWGDGSAATTGTVGVGSITKAYAAAGTYNVAVTVTDKDGGTATATRSVTVTTVNLQPNPLQEGTTALFVGGTNDVDSIRIEAGTAANSYRVRYNGSLLPGTFTPTGNTVVAFGQGGDDNINLFRVSPRAVFFGGDGNDYLTGSSGADVLVGNAGNDALDGYDGRDVLIGGTGRDTLNGMIGDDLLLAGRYANEGSVASLASLAGQWNGAGSTPTRATAIRAGLLSSGNVFNDSPIADSIVAGAGSDWFLADPTQDLLIDYTPSGTTPDVLTDIR